MKVARTTNHLFDGIPLKGQIKNVDWKPQQSLCRVGLYNECLTKVFFRQ